MAVFPAVGRDLFADGIGHIFNCYLSIKQLIDYIGVVVGGIPFMVLIFEPSGQLRAIGDQSFHHRAECGPGPDGLNIIGDHCSAPGEWQYLPCFARWHSPPITQRF